MNILICGDFSTAPWIWPFRNGFKKLGHDVRWTGLGGGESSDLKALGAVTEVETIKGYYTKEELAQFIRHDKYMVDIPMIDGGATFDTRPCYWTWDEVDKEIRRHLGDQWLPELILIFEMSFSFYGDRPKRWRGIPTGYIVSDVGPDQHLRQMERSGTDFCFLNGSWYWDIYKTYGANPIGIAPPCVDTDIFKPNSTVEAEGDIFFSGGNGLNINVAGSEEDYIEYGNRWKVSDYKWRQAQIYNQDWGEYGHRAEFIRAMMLSRQFTVSYYSNIDSPWRWAKAFRLGRISFCPQGGKYPYLAGFNGRLFASVACGRLTFASDAFGLGELYKDGEEIIAFKECTHYNHHHFFWADIGVLLDKIGYYLTHGKEREEIAMAGRKATIERHECSVRAQQVLNAIKEAGYL